jgi:hypothetical protein
MELFELFELLSEGVVDEIERSFSFSRAFLSFRSPTFSVSGSVHDKSAENMAVWTRREGVGSPGIYNVTTMRTEGEANWYHTN